MKETFPGPDQAPQTPPGAGPAPDEAAPGRLARMAGQAKRAAEWAAPVVHDALKQETGTDVYDFVGAEQPELSTSQKFGSGVARFAMRRAAERMAERSAQTA